MQADYNQKFFPFLVPVTKLVKTLLDEFQEHIKHRLMSDTYTPYLKMYCWSIRGNAEVVTSFLLEIFQSMHLWPRPRHGWVDEDTDRVSSPCRDGESAAGFCQQAFPVHFSKLRFQAGGEQSRHPLSSAMFSLPHPLWFFWVLWDGWYLSHYTAF